MNCYLTPAEKTAGKEFFCACNNIASIYIEPKSPLRRQIL